MRDQTAVELYVDTGDKEENKQIFDRLGRPVFLTNVSM
jgi:hypothetical protein